MNHVAEGVNGSVSVEIDHMMNIGMAGPGMVFVHSTDADVKQLAKMSSRNQYFVVTAFKLGSLRSNHTRRHCNENGHSRCTWPRLDMVRFSESCKRTQVCNGIPTNQNRRLLRSPYLGNGNG